MELSNGPSQMLIGWVDSTKRAHWRTSMLPLLTRASSGGRDYFGRMAELLASRHDAAPDYVDRLRACMREVAEMDWVNYMTGIPLVVSSCGEALEHGIETAFITAAIRRRNLPSALHVRAIVAVAATCACSGAWNIVRQRRRKNRSNY